MSRRERLQAWVRPVVRWVYLATGVLILPLVLEGLLEQVGILEPPLESTILDPIYVALLFSALAVGGLIFLGWPFAIAVLLLYGREWPLVTPAILFLVAEAAFAVSFIFPGSEAMFVVAGSLLGVYGIAAVRAWIRGRPRSRRRGSVVLTLALLLAVAGASVGAARASGLGQNAASNMT